MARKFLSHLDLSKNELQNAVIQNLASAPSTPITGQVYYNTTSGRFEFYGAASWIDPTARANHSGTQLASTISNFDTQVRTNTLSQMATPLASVNMGGQLVTSVATPVTSTDAATKGYVDALSNGTDWKASVRVASTANVAISGLLTIDGITLAASDRVLLKNQTAGADNGIYLAASGAWTRATDADTSAEVTAGMAMMVTEGTTQGDTQWVMSTNDVIVLGTTALVFVQIGASTSYVGGNGITITGNSIAVDTAVVSRKFASAIGAGTSVAITHNLNTLDVVVNVYEVSSGATVECDVVRNTVNQVTLGFTTAVTSGDYRVVVQG